MSPNEENEVRSKGQFLDDRRPETATGQPGGRRRRQPPRSALPPRSPQRIPPTPRRHPPQNGRMTSDESKSVLACLEACERKAIYLARIHRLQVELAAYELQRRALVSKDREAA